MQIQQQTSEWLDQNKLDSRSVREVIEDHIRLQVSGQLDEDLRRNYAADALLLTETGPHRGHAALRHHGGRLYRQGPGAYYEIASLQVQDSYALLVWKAGSSDYAVDCAADTFFVMDGRIRMQTSHAQFVQSDAGMANAG